MQTETDIQRQARGEHLKPTIFERTLRPRRDPYGDFSHCVFLYAGSGRIIGEDDETIDLDGPAIYFMPPALGHDLTLSAGSDCYLLGLSPSLLVDVIGNKPESVLLGAFLERPAVLSDLSAAFAGELLGYGRGFIKELSREDGGSWMALAAFARLVLIEIWRNSDTAADRDRESAKGDVLSLLQSFRQLVEVHFRAKLPVADYARQLGLTHDRLHDICRRHLNRTPMQLLHERAAHEAKLRLERSGDSIQKIAHQLGYNDAASFSHFFKRNTGYAPGVYRRLVQSQDKAADDSLSQSFADWP